MPTPVLYLSHGAPPLADDERWTAELADWASRLEKPKNVLIVSAHWEDAPTTLGSTTGAPLTYDFWGFPQHYYAVTYDAPAAPDLADDVTTLLTSAGGASSEEVRRDEARGLDHGAYVPLKEMFPDADVPVLQMSMPTLEPRGLFEVGRRLAPLREQGTLIVGSGFTTHNLRWLHPADGPDGPPPAASVEFDQWAAEAMQAQDVDSLLDFIDKAPAAHEAHPRTEHFAPLFVALGAAYASGDLASQTAIDGFWFGLSKRSWQFG